MPKGPIQSKIETRLTEALVPTSLIVTNDSGKHQGHSGDDGSGESHFTVEIKSAAFVGLSRLERQRLVNKTLGEMVGNQVHALAIKADTPTEVA
jgi:BolA family transcriptional regulator, general stress-responsive regulator